jgi:hypothetical protein
MTHGVGWPLILKRRLVTDMGTLRTQSVRAVVTAASAAAITATLLSGSMAVAAPGAARLPCRATMSNAHPADYTTTDVRVHTAAHAHVTTVAHYKTTKTRHHRTAGSKGNATIPYYISGATPGYKVTVSVSVLKGNRTGNCSTSFTPHR